MKNDRFDEFLPRLHGSRPEPYFFPAIADGKLDVVKRLLAIPDININAIDKVLNIV